MEFRSFLYTPVELGFGYAHRFILPGFSAGDALESACPDFDPVHLQARGILGSLVGTQVQTRETVFSTKCSLFFMVPPRSIHACVHAPGAATRNPGVLVTMDCWFGRVNQA
jgi:hypothetical protein